MSESVEYAGIAEYASQRAEGLTPGERRLVLACIAYDRAFTLFKHLIHDKRGKLGEYVARRAFNRLGVIGTASAARLPVFIVRGIGVGEQLRLLKLGMCTRNFRKPMTLFQHVENTSAAIAYLSVKYAWSTVKYKDTYLHVKRGSRLARINYKLRKREYERHISRDPLTTALENCRSQMAKEYNRRRWYFIHDILLILGGERDYALVRDGELAEAPMLTYRSGECPLFSLTVFDTENMYVAHAADVY